MATVAQCLIGRKSSSRDSALDIDLGSLGLVRMSHKHCVIACHDDGHWFLTNLGRNGTTINNVRLSKDDSAPINTDALISIGGHEFVFAIDP